jgi:hypothetical protein
MSGRSPKFEYRLEALIRLRSAERDALKTSANEAAREVEKRSRECDDLVHVISRAEGELRELCASGERIAVDEQMRLQAYLGEERRRHKAKRRELGEAVERMNKISAELQARSRDARALELHRERKRHAHDAEQQRASFDAADEL